MPVVSCSFEHHADDNTTWLGSTPILRENIRRWSEASQLSSPSTNLMRELAARWLFRVPPCHKGTIHLQTSMLAPEFEPMPYDTASLAIMTPFSSCADENMLAQPIIFCWVALKFNVTVIV
ncbi:hypothetical protein TNCV_4127881 [Trichonephila clavipes]|uniref:Uncharacterized protein n=1 Tax=Trichonephila clavipes TaxID=2585209 RepID=A0A8X6T3L2_TRICX|nr:hypothetical protein TNCV_4127881 [Trichonephila clavipes]